MKREFYLDLARSGLRMPIGTDLVLHEQADPQQVLLDGRRLGEVVEEAAHRYRTPLALAHMDLEVEKESLLLALGVAPDLIPTFHFDECPDVSATVTLSERFAAHPSVRGLAQVEAVSYIARHTDLVPVAMCIGPFSLMTKLLADPITPVCLAGSGVTAAEDAEVRRMEDVLELAFQTVVESIKAKVQAGARAVCIAEPAANKVYLSPRQIAQGADIFERYVMRRHRLIRNLLADAAVDLIFHCCGELIPAMVRHFGELDPAILSLGSSRQLWEDSALVSKQTVLFGNLPSKRFYSDDLTCEAVAGQARELVQRMRAADHPFILGSECDVLSVPGREAAIKSKVEAFLAATA